MSTNANIILGIDSSPVKTGVGIYGADTGKPLACWWGKHQSRLPVDIRETFHQVRQYGDPVVIALELPITMNKRQTFEAGQATGRVEAILAGMFPGVPFSYYRPDEWRKLVGVDITGKPKRNELKLRSIALAEFIGFHPDGNDDAAEGALISVAGYLEWSRAMEAEGDQ